MAGHHAAAMAAHSPGVRSHINASGRLPRSGSAGRTPGDPAACALALVFPDQAPNVPATAAAMTYKYKLVRDQVLQQALKSPHDALPSEHEICRLFHVSRTTAIKALNSLKAAKLVRREVGRGTFLNRKRLQTTVHLLIDGAIPELVDFATAAAEAFCARNPDLEVRPHPIDTADWVREIAIRPGPKVICCSHTGFLSSRGLLVPLQDLPDFPAVEGALCRNLITWRTGADGKRLCDAIPYLLTPDALAVNRGIARELGIDVERAPRDWAELAHWAGAVRGLRKHGQAVMGAPIKRNNMLPLSYLFSLHGGRTFLQADGADTRLVFDRGEEWLSYFRELHRSGAMPVYTARRPNPILFGNSFVAPWISSWIIGQRDRFRSQEDLVIHPIPAPGPGQQGHAMIGRSEVAMIRNEQAEARDVDAAWRLVRYLTAHEEAQALLIRHFTCLSVHRDVQAGQQRIADYQPFVQALQRGVHRNDHPLQHPVMRILYRYFYQCVLGDLPARDAARRIREATLVQLELAR